MIESDDCPCDDMKNLSTELYQLKMANREKALKIERLEFKLLTCKRLLDNLRAEQKRSWNVLIKEMHEKVIGEVYDEEKSDY